MCSQFYFETFSAKVWVTNENRAWLCDALFLTSNLHFQKLTNSNTSGICWKYIPFKISSRSVKFLCENVCFVSIVKGVPCFKWYEFICEPDELLCINSQLYDSRWTTTDNSLLVNDLRGNLVQDNGKPLEILSKNNILGLHFMSSNKGYGNGKYGFNGTITAGEQMAERILLWPSDIIIEKRVIAYQL